MLGSFVIRHHMPEAVERGTHALAFAIHAILVVGQGEGQCIGFCPLPTTSTMLG